MTRPKRSCSWIQASLENLDPWDLRNRDRIDAIRIHIRECPSCAQHLVDSVEPGTTAAWMTTEPPVRFRLHARLHRATRPFVIRWIAVASTALVMVIGGVFLFRGQHPTVSPPRSSKPTTITAKAPHQPPVKNVDTWPLVENAPPGVRMYTLRIDDTPVVLFYTAKVEQP